MVTPVRKRKAVVQLMDVHQVSQRPLPDRRFGKAKSAERGRAMCCKLIGLRCGICRVVVMMPNCEMQLNGFRGNGDDLAVAAST